MNAVLLRAAVSTTLLLNATFVLADHNARPDIEDKAFSALSQARHIRTVVRNDFSGSRSLGLLMDESTQLYRSARSIEESLLTSQPASVVSREIGLTRKALLCFREHLEASDFARVDVRHHRPTHGGYGDSFRASTRNPAYVHVLEIRQMLKDLDMTLVGLQNDMSLLSEVRSAPRAPLPVPYADRTRSTVEVPVNLGNRGGIVFRIPLK